MNPNYSSEQEKLYSDYAATSDEELLQMLENKNKYRNQVIVIISDILHERDKLPKAYAEEQAFKMADEHNEKPDEQVEGAVKDAARDDFIRGLVISGICFIIAAVIFVATGGNAYLIDWGFLVTGIFNLVIGLIKYMNKTD
jgi:hypothetical protein